jgi:predicted ATPase
MRSGYITFLFGLPPSLQYFSIKRLYSIFPHDSIIQVICNSKDRKHRLLLYLPPREKGLK